MTANQIFIRMCSHILHSGGFHSDVNHMQKVHSFARIIGTSEGLDPHDLFILEVAAILHDIACPALRARHGYAPGKEQETLGPEMARTFLADCGLSAEDTDRVCFLIGHHHTIEDVEGLDWQILLEADYLVNADESETSESMINKALARIFKTRTGIALVHALFLGD